jgi:hypothetical protein
MKQTQHDCSLSVQGPLQLLGIQKYFKIIQPFDVQVSLRVPQSHSNLKYYRAQQQSILRPP